MKNVIIMLNILFPFLLVLLLVYDIYVKTRIVDTNISLEKSIDENTMIYNKLHTILDSNGSSVLIVED